MENRTILFQGKEIDVDDEPGETSDMIHHPNHYTWRGTEAIDIVRAMTRGSEGVEAYLLGCTVKYMYRFPKKNGAQDLEKAVQCLKMLREIRYGKPLLNRKVEDMDILQGAIAIYLFPREVEE